MRVDILTLFPEMFESPMNASMMWKARDRNLLDLHLHNIRDYSTSKHRTVDDTPYGGGGGMVMKVDVIASCLQDVKQQASMENTPVILMSPQGRVLSHDIAAELSQHERMIILCGHYEGVDERVRDLLITDEISIGDYVLTGGELAAMVLIDAVLRHQPGLLGAEGAHERDSHANGLLEGPHYTRPQSYQGLTVPEVLQNGDHKAIDSWRYEQALYRTWKKRPDLLMKAKLPEAAQYLLAKFALKDARTDNSE